MLIRELLALNKNEEDDTPYKKKLRFYSRIPLLILDEWLAEPVPRTDTVIIQELIDDRWNRTSTIFCSQLALPMILPLFIGLDGVLWSFPLPDILTFLISLYFVRSTYRELSSSSLMINENLHSQRLEDET